MSKKINIRGLTDNSNDSFYRYKMEKIICIEQKGKSVVQNIDSISKALDRDCKYIINYFKKSLGTSIIYKDNKLIISKLVSVNDLEQILFEFIEYYVICHSCKNPETELTFDKKNNPILSCKACSHIG